MAQRWTLVFGDSMSDIGYMKASNKIPDFLSGVNKYGRFSTSKNWVDYFVESRFGVSCFNVADPEATSVASQVHRHLEKAFEQVSNNQLYCNYAKGGAIVLNSWAGVSWSNVATYKALSTLDNQVSLFEEELNKLTSVHGTHIANEVNVIVWLGANDLVTVKRNENGMEAAVKHLNEQLRRITRLLNEKVNGAAVKLMLINVPDLTKTIRLEELGQEAKSELIGLIELWNAGLKSIYERANEFNLNSCTYIDLYSNLTPEQTQQFGFVHQLGEHVMLRKVFDHEAGSPLIYHSIPDSITDTSPDGLHPSAEMHELIATYILKNS
ncbi:hypothetical protein J8M20_04465 [Pseudoalteromonas luteoviolacea]|uniref:SGNH/GDSL hydrolase family protein n=1 Tax=Pseudoalteromonas luteoviolacea TaxID=43657 RepID=UPI001B39A707|nr:SGNH/GDSL hydrolase family protein [Pseudoalteromonas luteoviolacea]MBQ4810573.1 hypothetical protein [Pseudoalteromonas luteoviolacea]